MPKTNHKHKRSKRSQKDCEENNDENKEEKKKEQKMLNLYGRRNGALKKAMSPFYHFHDETTNTGRLVKELTKWLEEWSSELFKKSNKYDESLPPPPPPPLIIITGSHRLGVHGKDSDIDACVLCPSHVTRHEFFGEKTSNEESDLNLLLPNYLRKQLPNSHVQSIDAKTPVIKIVQGMTQVDLLFASVSSWSTIQEIKKSYVAKTKACRRWSYIISPQHMKDIIAGRLSINGVRTTQILEEVLITKNESHAPRVALKMLRLIFQQRGIYSGLLGFFSGVMTAIVVAHVVQEHNMNKNLQLNQSKIAEDALKLCCEWEWGEMVLQLDDTEDSRNDIQGTDLPILQWERKPNEVMAILTPAHPRINSASNVRRPQFRRIKYEVQQVYDKLSAATIKEQVPDYDKLIGPSNFFSEHEHFCQVTIDGSTEWRRLVLSQLRFLFTNMEEEKGVKTWPHAVEYNLRPKSTTFFIALELTTIDSVVGFLACQQKKFLEHLERFGRKAFLEWFGGKEKNLQGKVALEYKNANQLPEAPRKERIMFNPRLRDNCE